MAPAPAPAPLSFWATPDSLLLEPAGGQGPALLVDRRSGALSLRDSGPPALRVGAPAAVHGVLGVIHLLDGPYLVLITGCEHVVTLHGAPIYAVTGTRVVPYGAPAASARPGLDRSERRDEARYLRLLQSALRERGLFFSLGVDLTLSAQRAAGAAADPAVAARPRWARGDRRFFWNRYLQQPLIDLGADSFVIPVIRGFVQQLGRLTLGGRAAELLLSVRGGGQQRETAARVQLASLAAAT